jgi:uncharacterized membrane protein YkvA (DUF1232 family)
MKEFQELPPDKEILPPLKNKIHQRLEQIKIELYALYYAYKDPRVSIYARLFAACVVGYAFSPIDLIPDPIPILGYLDDLIIIPVGIWLALKMIPSEVMAEARLKARERLEEVKPVNWLAGVIILLVWLVMAVLFIHFLWQFFGR